MVRFLIELVLIIVALLLAVPLAQSLFAETGYVLVYINQAQQYETNLIGFVVLLLAAALLIHLLIYVVAKLVTAPKLTAKARRQARQKHADQELMEGLGRLAEGDWSKAEANLSRSASVNDAEHAGLALAAAAVAAERQSADWRRDDYLRRGKRLAKPHSTITSIAEAELMLERNEPVAARDILLPIYRLEPRKPQVLRLLADSYARLGEWRNLLSLLPDLKRQRAVKPHTYQDYQRRAYSALMQAIGGEGSARQVRRFWDEAIPKSMRVDPMLLTIFARQLSRCGDVADAEKLLRRALARGIWSDELIATYSEIEHNASTQLGVVEALQDRHSESPGLLLAIGRLARRVQQYERAKTSLQESLRLRPDVDTYRELGETLEAMNDWEMASKAYRRGLMVAASRETVAEEGPAAPTPPQPSMDITMA